MTQLQVGDRVKFRRSYLADTWGIGTVAGFIQSRNPPLVQVDSDCGEKGAVPENEVFRVIELPPSLKRYPNSEVYLGEIYLGNIQDAGWYSYNVMWCPPGRSAVDAGTVDNPDFGLWLLWQAHIKGRLPDGQAG